MPAVRLVEGSAREAVPASGLVHPATGILWLLLTGRCVPPPAARGATAGAIYADQPERRHVLRCGLSFPRGPRLPGPRLDGPLASRAPRRQLALLDRRRVPLPADGRARSAANGGQRQLQLDTHPRVRRPVVPGPVALLHRVPRRRLVSQPAAAATDRSQSGGDPEPVRRCQASRGLRFALRPRRPAGTALRLAAPHLAARLG